MSNRKSVETYLSALYREHKDFEAIEALLADGFTFNGPMASFDGRAAFMEFIRKIGPQKNRIEVREIVADGDAVAVFHEFTSEMPVIGPLPFAEWYSMKGGKIASLTLYFDAREFAPLLEEQMPRD